RTWSASSTAASVGRPSAHDRPPRRPGALLRGGRPDRRGARLPDVAAADPAGRVPLRAVVQRVLHPGRQEVRPAARRLQGGLAHLPLQPLLPGRLRPPVTPPGPYLVARRRGPAARIESPRRTAGPRT